MVNVIIVVFLTLFYISTDQVASNQFGNGGLEQFASQYGTGKYFGGKLGQGIAHADVKKSPTPQRSTPQKVAEKSAPVKQFLDPFSIITDKTCGCGVDCHCADEKVDHGGLSFFFDYCGAAIDYIGQFCGIDTSYFHQGLDFFSGLSTGHLAGGGLGVICFSTLIYYFVCCTCWPCYTACYCFDTFSDCFLSCFPCADALGCGHGGHGDHGDSCDPTELCGACTSCWTVGWDICQLFCPGCDIGCDPSMCDPSMCMDCGSQCLAALE